MRALVLLKPDAVERNIIGELISRLENENLKIVAMKMLKMTERQARKFYSVHRGKSFYESLVRYIASGAIVALVVQGENAIFRVRKLMGATDPSKAEKGTIRQEYGLSIERNTIHGSDSLESAEYETKIIFSKNELVE
ncbi:MAG: nucleoside-diphosphate kinase [Candidatus Thermoplasmatota archaeon]|nr:nucleoside-diphosphate kinase [Candidatus Thermoplasmatota archaeon]MDI6856130.1 nucleoside-diphosphate kinase [Candidatus Thermoplasmatota archaeon]MDI6887285.1 nucleoside-diphosphate kinase [Candidatus Thermoplasmatota archaeon]